MVGPLASTRWTLLNAATSADGRSEARSEPPNAASVYVGDRRIDRVRAGGIPSG